MKSIINLFDWASELNNVIIDAIDRDLVLLENPVVSAQFDFPFKLDVTTAIICTSGEIAGSMNMKKSVSKAPCMITVLPDQILEYEGMSPDFKGYFIVMSKRFTDSLLLSIQERLPLMLSVNENPTVPLNDSELTNLIGYFHILQRTVRMINNPNRIEIVKHLIQAFFYSSGQEHHLPKTSKNQSKNEFYAEKYLMLVRENYKKERELEFYADKLCLSTKYLSKVIKDTTGICANEWINKYVVLEAKALLKSTNMTIQQISDELNFPSQSFFGKYFKRIVGVSPKSYRG